MKLRLFLLSTLVFTGFLALNSVAQPDQQQESASAKRLDKATKAERSLGIEISELRSYWTVDPNVLGGQAITVPFIRFKVKNIGLKPLKSLSVTASFELTEKKEVLGKGSAYIVGFSDPPLKLGYSKEVFFGSTTGFTGGRQSDFPAVTADLYFQTDILGDMKLARTVTISDEFQP